MNSVRENGRLSDAYLPAIYFDSSVLIYYWLAEGLEGKADADVEEVLRNNDFKSRDEFLREIFRQDKYIEKGLKLREAIAGEEAKLTAVITPLCIYELFEWHVETVFKELLSDAVSYKEIQKKGKKDLGDALKKVIDAWDGIPIDIQKGLNSFENLNRPEYRKAKAIRLILVDIWLNDSFALAHGFHGLNVADIREFNFRSEDIFGNLGLFACLHLGAADLLHILFASHLGCKYIASYDSDHLRAKDHIKALFGIEVVSTPQEIIRVITGRPSPAKSRRQARR